MTESKKPVELKTAIISNNVLIAAEVVVEFIGRTYGSLPKDENLLTNWLESKQDRKYTEGGRYGDEDTTEEKLKALGLTKSDPEVKIVRDFLNSQDKENSTTSTVVDGTSDKDGMLEEEEKVSCAFRSYQDPKTGVIGQVISDFMLKAAIGQVASTMKLTTSVRGTKPNLRDGLQIRPQRIFLTRNNLSIIQPDGVEDFIGHVMTAQGRRSILKRCDYVDKAQLAFKIYWVGGLIPHETMEKLIKLAGIFNGLGSQRRFEAGKFKILSYTPIKDIDIEELIN